MFFGIKPDYLKAVFMAMILIGVTLACRLQGEAPIRSPSLIQIPVNVHIHESTVGPKMVLERLRVDFLGNDGYKVIGSGCPGIAGKGVIEDYHLMVYGVDRDKKVQRVLVAGDNSTLTWEWPCDGDWELLARDLGRGKWDVFIAPSLPTRSYAVLFFTTTIRWQWALLILINAIKVGNAICDMSDIIDFGAAVSHFI